MSDSHDAKVLIIDTDMAADDWMAILYLLQSPLVDVQGITIAATGETHIKPGIQTGLRLLGIADQEGIPITTGRTTPLQGDNSFPLLWIWAMDIRLGLRLPKTIQKRDDRSAVDLMVEILETAVSPITIVALGPLTNIGELLQTRPDLKEMIAHIFIMGGAFNVQGNIEGPGVRIKNPYGEWNIFVDPHAANLVFQAGVPTTLVPLDATNKAPLTFDFYEKVETNQETAVTAFFFRIIKRLKSLLGKNTFYFWDPLTAVIATHQHIGQYINHPVQVIEEEGIENGRTIKGDSGPDIHICMDVDTAAFEQIFLDTLNDRL